MQDQDHEEISGMLKVARSALSAGAESDIAFIFKIEAKLIRVVELKNVILGNGSKIETKLITVELKMNQKWIKN